MIFRLPCHVLVKPHLSNKKTTKPQLSLKWADRTALCGIAVQHAYNGYARRGHLCTFASSQYGFNLFATQRQRPWFRDGELEGMCLLDFWRGAKHKFGRKSRPHGYLNASGTCYIQSSSSSCCCFVAVSYSPLWFQADLSTSALYHSEWRTYTNHTIKLYKLKQLKYRRQVLGVLLLWPPELL